ncbi:MAG: nucleotidyltransferase family protein [Elusimicrobia bacterium]|nr:nucleotidyltransferase family protein [Elusimicrobiota bacterium]
MDELGDLIWNLVDRSAGNAERHHVAALLHRHQPLSARDEDRQCFANAYRRTMAGNLLFLEATRDVLAQLHDNEISAIPLKGSFFALRFYGNLGVRPQNDVDILVKKRTGNKPTTPSSAPTGGKQFRGPTTKAITTGCTRGRTFCLSSIGPSSRPEPARPLWTGFGKKRPGHPARG